MSWCKRVLPEARRLIIVVLTTGATAVSGRATLAGAVVPAQPSAGCRADSIDRTAQHTIDVGGTQRRYVLDVPEQLQPHVPVSLLFDFHGFGDSAARLAEVSAFHPLAARDGFIVVYPDGLPVHLLGRDAPGWEIFTTKHNRDLAFTTALLERLERDYCIDEARVFVTGFSNGAFFSHLLGCTMPERFAAIAPVSGGLTTPCAPPRTVPVIMHHGTRDPLVDVERARQARDTWLRIDGCRRPSRSGRKSAPLNTPISGGCERYRQCRNGAEVEYCENDGEHHWPADAAARIWDFFRDHPMPRVVRR